MHKGRRPNIGGARLLATDQHPSSLVVHNRYPFPFAKITRVVPCCLLANLALAHYGVRDASEPPVAEHGNFVLSLSPRLSDAPENASDDARDSKRQHCVVGVELRGCINHVEASVIGALAIFVWWFIAASPVVQDLDKRLTRLDDSDFGRMPGIERQNGW